MYVERSEVCIRGSYWYHKTDKYALGIPRSLNAPNPADACIHQMLRTRSYLTTRRSSDLPTIGRRSFMLFGSRSCAGTSWPLDASFW